MLTSIYKRRGRAGVTLAFEDPATGKIRQRQFSAKGGRSAKERALDAVAELRARAKLPQAEASDVTFPDFAQRWLRATKTAVRAGTYRNYEANVRVHLAPAFPGPVREITRGQVRDLITTLRAAGMKKSSVSNIRGTLHAILEAAGPDEEGILLSNPAHYRSKSKLMRLGTTPGERRANVKALDEGQAHAFLKAASIAAPRHAMLFRTMLATGLRPGEAIGLQPGDLDYHGGRIRVVRAITRGRIEPCKTTAAGEAEWVDMPEGLADELRAWEASCAAEALASGRPRSPWLFPGSTGGPRPRATEGHLDDSKRLGYAFARVLKKAGLSGHYTPHCLRHSYATQLLINGESIYYVQRQLRHADISMTIATYGSSLPAGNRAAADRHYARLVGGKVTPEVTARKPQAPQAPPQSNRKRPV